MVGAPEVFGEGVIHSFCQVFRRPLVLDLQPLARRDFGVATSRLRRELGDRPGPRGGDLASDLDELLIPCVERVGAGILGRHPLEQAVALLEHPAEPGQGTRVARLDLDKHLVEEPAPELRTGLDKAQVVRPEEHHPEVAG